MDRECGDVNLDLQDLDWECGDSALLHTLSLHELLRHAEHAYYYYIKRGRDLLACFCHGYPLRFWRCRY